jgi:hypothetical protein
MEVRSGHVRIWLDRRGGVRQVRTGQEMTGQEMTGKEMAGHERTGQNRIE